MMTGKIQPRSSRPSAGSHQRPADDQEPEGQRHLDRQGHRVVMPPARHPPLAQQVARPAVPLVDDLGGEPDPILRERRLEDPVRPRLEARARAGLRASGCDPPRALRGIVANPVTTRFASDHHRRRTATIPRTTVRTIPASRRTAPTGPRPRRPSQRSIAQSKPRIGGIRTVVNLHDIARPPSAAGAQKSRRLAGLEEAPEAEEHRRRCRRRGASPSSTSAPWASRFGLRAKRADGHRHRPRAVEPPGPVRPRSARATSQIQSAADPDDREQLCLVGDRVVDPGSQARAGRGAQSVGACWSFQKVSGEPIRVIASCSPVRHQWAATSEVGDLVVGRRDPDRLVGHQGEAEHGRGDDGERGTTGRGRSGSEAWVGLLAHRRSSPFGSSRSVGRGDPPAFLGRSGGSRRSAGRRRSRRPRSGPSTGSPRTSRWKWSLSSSPTVGSSGSRSSCDPLGVGPLDPVGHLQPGDAPLGEDLDAGLGQEPAGLAPGGPVVSAGRDLRRAPAVEFEQVGHEVGVGCLAARAGSSRPTPGRPSARPGRRTGTSRAGSCPGRPAAAPGRSGSTGRAGRSGRSRRAGPARPPAGAARASSPAARGAGARSGRTAGRTRA